MTDGKTLVSAGFYQTDYMSKAYTEAKQVAYNHGLENPDYVFDFRDDFQTIQEMLGKDFIRIIRSGICATSFRTQILANDMWEMYQLGQERAKKGWI